MTDFARLKLIEPLRRALAEIGYVTMTPVQVAALPAVLEGRDVLAQAITGSGKTAVFALGLLSTLDATAVRLQGLVLCPMRELADQVSREIRRRRTTTTRSSNSALSKSRPKRKSAHSQRCFCSICRNRLSCFATHARMCALSRASWRPVTSLCSRCMVSSSSVRAKKCSCASQTAVAPCSPREMARANVIEDRLGEPLHWGSLPATSSQNHPLFAPFVTLAVDAGRKDKLRPGDLLGALTGDAALPATAIGKIEVFPTRTYVAIKRGLHDQALQRLRSGKIKGRTFGFARSSREPWPAAKRPLLAGSKIKRAAVFSNPMSDPVQDLMGRLQR